METELKKTFSWEVDNFSERNNFIRSNSFSSSSGCEWNLRVYPKGHGGSDHLSVILGVPYPKSLSFGWKRRFSACFVLLNQSGKELYRSPEGSAESESNLFCNEISSRIFNTLPLSKLQENGVLENNKLIIEVYIKIIEVVHHGKSTANEILHFKGFKIVAYQAVSLSKIFREHPNFAKGFTPKNQEVKTTYINLLLGLIKTLNKPSRRLSVIELSNAQSELTELTEAGFELDWLKTKLEEVVASQTVSVRKIFEHPDFAVDFKPTNREVKTSYMNLLLGLVDTLSKSSQSLSTTELSTAQSDLTELTEAGFKLDWLKTKLEEVTLDKKKSVSDGSLVLQLEERVKNLELTLSNVNKVELDKKNCLTLSFSDACVVALILAFLESILLFLAIKAYALGYFS